VTAAAAPAVDEDRRAHIRALVDQAPPLSPARAEALARVLRPLTTERGTS
jgi:hypothetical protein